MKKSIFIIITLLVISMSSASAQVVWGVRAGVSLPSVSISGDDASDVFEGKIGLEVGPTLYYSFKNNFYINSGVMFSHKSFDFNVYVEELGYRGLKTENMSMDYLEIPLNVGIAIPLGKVQSYAQLGPYFGYKLSESFPDKYSESGVSDFNAGIGFMYGLNINKFKIEVGYQYGLSNMDDSDTVDMTFNSLFLGISYVF